MNELPAECQEFWRARKHQIKESVYAFFVILGAMGTAERNDDDIEYVVPLFQEYLVRGRNECLNGNHDHFLHDNYFHQAHLRMEEVLIRIENDHRLRQ
ncbi:unnamed protein product [Caenorhabditis bovis]|uniref:Uncharacterized protein n=1 Tax=Caenorhabditis bovis TaxID=2654633 RepID=A0A8S1FCT5_9PELO|nr:unnamed protein product [Caenorhabditis bovis]